MQSLRESVNCILCIQQSVPLGITDIHSPECISGETVERHVRT